MTIVVLLSCLKGWCQNNDDSFPLRGEADSSNVVSISSNDIKSANVKLLERKMLLEITAEQDSIIAFKDSYILEQERIIKDFQNRVTKSNGINNDLAKSLDRQKKITYVVGGVAGAALLTTVVLILVK